MRIRTFLRRVAHVLCGYLALTAIAGVWLAGGALHPGRRVLSDGDEIKAQIIAHSYHSELRNVVVLAQDGVTLRAWNLQPQDSNGNAVILLHGVGDTRMGMIGYAGLFLRHGFSVLLPDARGHGASGGQFTSYGLLESDDIHRWFDWLELNQHPGCIFGFGESMGAAQLLQSLSVESRFCAVAAESPFSSFREIAYDRIGQFCHIGPWIGRSVLHPVVAVAFGFARWKYNLDFERLSPEWVVGGSRVPVLLIHGRVDSNIPLRHSHRIAARNQTVVLWEVPGAEHCGAISTAPQELEQRLVDWFDRRVGGIARVGTQKTWSRSGFLDFAQHGVQSCRTIGG